MSVDSSTRNFRWVSLIVLCAGFLMIILDQTIVNVALPSIQSDLGFTQAGLVWVVNAYLIAFGGLLLLAGRLGDLIGRKRVFLGGLAVFAAASLWCGLADSAGMLIAARFVQGAGAAVTSAVILGMVVTLFSDDAERGKALGVYSFVGAGGAAIGLLAGGVITQGINWNWIFFVNVPIGLVVGFVGLRVLDRDTGPGLREGADVLGAVLVTGALMLGVYTILKVEDYGWLAGHTLGFGAVSIGLVGLFVLRQAKASQALLPLRIFRTPNLAAANLVLALMLAGMFAQFFLGTLYLVRVLGFDPVEVGLGFLPVAVTIGVLSVVVSPKVNARFGMKAVIAPSLLSIAAGLVLLGRAPVSGSYVVDVMPALFLLGVGGGLAFPALVGLAMSGAQPADAGLASGINNTTQQVGGALGLAVLGSLAAARTGSEITLGVPQVEALTSGYHLAFFTAAGIVTAGALLALLVLRDPSAASAAADDETPVRGQVPEPVRERA